MYHTPPNYYYPHAFLKKRRGYCNHLRLSIRQSRYLLLNHRTKSNQIWCVSCSHEWGVQRPRLFFGPPWGPGEGPNGQISLNIIKIQLQSQCQRFLNQTLCVFSQMKDIKHIRRDFHFPAWVMPQGWDLVVLQGVGAVKKKNSETENKERNNHSTIQPDFVCELLTWMAHATAPFFFLGGGGGCRPLGPWGGAKGQRSLNLNYKVNVKDFINQTLWIFSQMKDIWHIRRDFHLANWVMPRDGTWGYHGGLGCQNKFSAIKLDLVCELLTWVTYAVAQFFGSPPPGALGRGRKI